MGSEKGKPQRKKLTKFQRLALRELVNFTCEECHKKEKEIGMLEPHRMDQRLGYIPRNIKMLCNNCHEEFSAAQRIAIGTQSH